MKLVSLQENLKKGLNIVGHISSKNINLPILNNILIKADSTQIELISTNLEIGINHKLRGKVEKEGEFTIDSKLINEYISLLTGGEKVELELKGNELKIECGDYKTKIKGEESVDFPLIPNIPRDLFFSCDLIKFKKSLSNIVFAASGNENRLELTGVLFSFLDNKLILTATDSYRLAEKELELKNEGKIKDEQKVIVPVKTAQELIRILSNLEKDLDSIDSEIKFYLSENQILFTFDSVELISRVISGNYPEYKQIIPTKSSTEALIDRGELIRAVKAASLFSKTGINDITLIFSKNKLLVSSFSGSSGESQIKIDSQINGDDNEITINYRYLLDGLNNIEGSSVKIDILNNMTPCIIKPEKEDGYLYLVMPIKQ